MKSSSRLGFIHTKYVFLWYFNPKSLKDEWKGSNEPPPLPLLLFLNILASNLNALTNYQILLFNIYSCHFSNSMRTQTYGFQLIHRENNALGSLQLPNTLH